MTSRRMRDSKRNETELAQVLRELGNDVHDYGLALLTDEARTLLRGVKEPDRWIADFLVSTILKERAYVDAKFSYLSKGENHSIEMRSLLWGKFRERGLPTYYVCSTLDHEGHFGYYQAIEASTVPTSWPCCQSCDHIFKTSPNPMAELPDYCPRDDLRGSGTPFYVIKPSFFLDRDIFGLHSRPEMVLRRDRRRYWELYDARGPRCPLCYDDHPGCRWVAGSLFCVNDPCANPHHQPEAA